MCNHCLYGSFSSITSIDYFISTYQFSPSLLSLTSIVHYHPSFPYDLKPCSQTCSISTLGDPRWISAAPRSQRTPPHSPLAAYPRHPPSRAGCGLSVNLEGQAAFVCSLSHCPGSFYIWCESPSIVVPIGSLDSRQRAPAIHSCVGGNFLSTTHSDKVGLSLPQARLKDSPSHLTGALTTSLTSTHPILFNRPCPIQSLLTICVSHAHTPTASTRPTHRTAQPLAPQHHTLGTVALCRAVEPPDHGDLLLQPYGAALSRVRRRLAGGVLDGGGIVAV